MDITQASPEELIALKREIEMIELPDASIVLQGELKHGISS